MSITKGHGVVLEYGDAETYDDSSTWTKIAKVVDITPPTVEADDIETSNMDSPGQHKEYEAGWADGGEVEATIQFDTHENNAVYQRFRTKAGHRITFDDGSFWGFTGYIKSFGNEVEREGLITTSITLKVSGKPLFIPPTPPVMS